MHAKLKTLLFARVEMPRPTPSAAAPVPLTDIAFNCDGRDTSGRLCFLSRHDSLALVANLFLIDVVAGESLCLIHGASSTQQ